MNKILNKQEIENFLKEVKKSKDLRNLVGKVDSKLKNTKEDEQLIEKEIVPAAKNLGFNFTAPEFLSYLKVATKSLGEESLSKVGGGADRNSAFGGKIGKIALLLGGGAAVGTGGMLTFNHFRNAKKADVSAVSAVQNKETPKENTEETKSGENKDKETSTNLKDTLEKHPEKEGNKQNTPPAPTKNNAPQENNKAAKPNIKAPEQNKATPKEQKQLSAEELKQLDQFFDQLLTEDALNQAVEAAKAQGQTVSKEQLKSDLMKIKNGTPEMKIQFMQMMMQMGEAMQQQMGKK